jgi:xylose isomerase
MVDQKDGALAELVRKRYQSFDTEIGAQIEVKLSQLFLLLIYLMPFVFNLI